MNRNQFLDYCRLHEARLAGYDVEQSEAAAPYVFYDRSSKATDLRFALTWSLEKRSGTTPSFHNVVVSYTRQPDGEECFDIWCGDSFLEGKLHEADRISRIDEAVASATASWMNPELKSSVKESLHDLQTSTLRQSTGCNFWKVKPKGEVCKHVKHVMSAILANEASRGLHGDKILDYLPSAWNLVAAGSETAGTLPRGASLEAAAVLQRAAFKSHVLLLGPQGAGKTHMARKMAEGNGVSFIEAGCHNGTETADLLGSVAPYGTHWVWKDGPVTEAFRRAANGEKVVLLLDELLRVQRRPLSALLTALSPYQGQYFLRTGRILSEENGVGTEEMLTCDKQNVMVVATANVGLEFDQDSIDPALKSRFTEVYVENDESLMATVLAQAVAARGWVDRPDVALVRFCALVEQAVEAGLLATKANVRVMLRCIEMADDAFDVEAATWTERLQFVGRSMDGKPLDEHLEYLQTVLRKAFTATTKRKGKVA